MKKMIFKKNFKKLFLVKEILVKFINVMNTKERRDMLVKNLPKKKIMLMKKKLIRRSPNY
jgi:hypothetical protein